VLGIVCPDDYDMKKYRCGDLLTEESGIYDYYDEIILGARPDKMKDNETLLEFKTRIVKEMKKCGLKVDVKDLGWIKDGGYDG
jgi:hypothetical protein